MAIFFIMCLVLLRPWLTKCCNILLQSTSMLVTGDVHSYGKVRMFGSGLGEHRFHAVSMSMTTPRFSKSRVRVRATVLKSRVHVRARIFYESSPKRWKWTVARKWTVLSQLDGLSSQNGRSGVKVDGPDELKDKSGRSMSKSMPRFSDWVWPCPCPRHVFPKTWTPVSI